MRWTLKERFEKKVDRSGECHEWTAALNAAGYGVIGKEGGRGAGNMLAHRASWLLETGEDPGEMEVMHLCNNPKCVRIDHLELGTHKDNMSYASKCDRFQNRCGKYVGTDNHMAYISFDKVQWAREQVASGRSHRSVAEEIGTSKASVTDWVNFKSRATA